jgi:predicted nucleic acid-binding protein
VALTLLDASVVIAWLESTDSLHDRAERALLSVSGDDLRLPVSSYAEVMVGAIRRGEADTVRRAMSELSLTIEPMTTPIAERAATLRAGKSSLSLPDAFVLATAEELGADRVLTADLSWRGLLPSVTLID